MVLTQVNPKPALMRREGPWTCESEPLFTGLAWRLAVEESRCSRSRPVRILEVVEEVEGEEAKVSSTGEEEEGDDTSATTCSGSVDGDPDLEVMERWEDSAVALGGDKEEEVRPVSILEALVEEESDVSSTGEEEEGDDTSATTCSGSMDGHPEVEMMMEGSEDSAVVVGGEGEEVSVPPSSMEKEDAKEEESDLRVIEASSIPASATPTENLEEIEECSELKVTEAGVPPPSTSTEDGGVEEMGEEGYLDVAEVKMSPSSTGGAGDKDKDEESDLPAVEATTPTLSGPQEAEMVSVTPEVKTVKKSPPPEPVMYDCKAKFLGCDTRLNEYEREGHEEISCPFRTFSHCQYENCDTSFRSLRQQLCHLMTCHGVPMSFYSWGYFLFRYDRRDFITFLPDFPRCQPLVRAIIEDMDKSTICYLIAEDLRYVSRSKRGTKIWLVNMTGERPDMKITANLTIFRANGILYTLELLVLPSLKYVPQMEELQQDPNSMNVYFETDNMELDHVGQAHYHGGKYVRMIVRISVTKKVEEKEDASMDGHIDDDDDPDFHMDYGDLSAKELEDKADELARKLEELSVIDPSTYYLADALDEDEEDETIEAEQDRKQKRKKLATLAWNLRQKAQEKKLLNLDGGPKDTVDVKGQDKEQKKGEMEGEDEKELATPEPEPCPPFVIPDPKTFFVRKSNGVMSSISAKNLNYPQPKEEPEY